MLRLFIALSLLLCSLTAQDEARLLADFHKALHPGKGKPIAVAMVQPALAALGTLDSAKMAEALLDGWSAVDDEANTIDLARQGANAEMAELIKGQEASEHRTFQKDKLERFNQLKAQVEQQRTEVEALRELQDAIGKRIRALRSKDTLLWLLQKGIGSKRPLPAKLAAMGAVGSGADAVLADLGAALAHAREPEDLIALLEAMAQAGTTARPHAALVIAQLQAKDEAVRERAAMALAKIAVPSAIEPMIALLGKSSGQTRVRVVEALEVLTGQKFGGNVGSWQAWYAAEGKAIQDPDTLGKGKPGTAARKEQNRNYYFGIPQSDSSSIFYVIDCSGSMTAPIELKLDNGTGTAETEKTTRLEGCKKELCRALQRLRPEQKFGILWFNDMPHLWEPKIQPATKEAVARAQAFVQTLKAASSTNIYDSLQTCFGMVGRGARDKWYGVELDTIFLLTDGSPTTPDGKLDSTEKILTGVREWNPLKRVVIHTIAVGKDVNVPFLQQLARDNGGEFKQY